MHQFISNIWALFFHTCAFQVGDISSRETQLVMFDVFKLITEIQE